MDKLASSFALEDSPGEPEGEGDERLDLLHKKTLRLGETDTDDDDDDLPETRGSLETKKTLDYTEVSKKVGYFNLNPSIFFFCNYKCFSWNTASSTKTKHLFKYMLEPIYTSCPCQVNASMEEKILVQRMSLHPVANPWHQPSNEATSPSTRLMRKMKTWVAPRRVEERVGEGAGERAEVVGVPPKKSPNDLVRIVKSVMTLKLLDLVPPPPRKRSSQLPPLALTVSQSLPRVRQANVRNHVLAPRQRHRERMLTKQPDQVTSRPSPSLFHLRQSLRRKHRSASPSPLVRGVTQVRQNQDQTQMPSLRPAALGNLLPRVLGSLRQRQRVPSLASLPRKVVPQSQTQRPRRDPAKAVPTMLPAKRHSKKAKLKRKPLNLARRLG